MELPLK